MTDNIITCECGVKVRLPNLDRSRSFQCPKCNRAIALTNDLKVLFSSDLGTCQSAVCPICQTEINSAESCVTCPDCDQIHHRECWSEIGGCGTYGCKQAPAVADSDKTPQAPLTAWGDTKECPACGEVIKSIALKCRYCHTSFDSIDPMTLGELKNQYDRGDVLETMRKSIIGLFIFSMIGILAPIVLVVSLIYVLPQKKQISKTGPIFTILAWVSVGLNIFYTLLIILFYMMSN